MKSYGFMLLLLLSVQAWAGNGIRSRIGKITVGRSIYRQSMFAKNNETGYILERRRYSIRL